MTTAIRSRRHFRQANARGQAGHVSNKIIGCLSIADVQPPLRPPLSRERCRARRERSAGARLVSGSDALPDIRALNHAVVALFNLK